MNSTRTIFITSFNPFATRNILFSDAFKLLSRQSDLRLVIFCPDYKKDYFQEKFGGENVIIEGIKTELVTKQDIIFSYLGRSVINTGMLSLHRREIFHRNHKIFNFLFSYFIVFFGYLPFIKKIIRWLDLRTIDGSKLVDYFDQYRPDLVFALDVFHMDDVHFLAEAKKLSIATVGMVRSWDNISGKGLFRMKPDKLVVNNEIIRDEAIKHEDVAMKNIFVSGMPQFDFYFNYQPVSREIFFKTLNFDPKKKKTILVAPHGSRFFKYDWQIFEILKTMPYQFILRLPPNDKIDFASFKPSENFFIEHPGLTFQEGVYRDRELSVQDSQRLADELHHCELVVSYGSTIIIDAAFFDKPVVMIAFDGLEKKSYIESEKRYLKYAHMEKMLKTNCCWTADSATSLKKGIETYLAEPALHREGRKKLLEQELWKLDGQSGKRIAEFILKQLV